jgi:hypothetical protein
MSVQAMTWVFGLDGEDAPKLGTRLVLLALADNAGPRGDDERMVAWPSVATLAHKARLSERATQYALRSLRDDGLIAEVGKSPAGTVIYALSMRVQILHPGGADSAPGEVKPASPEPSLEPSLEEVSIETSSSEAHAEPSRPTSQPPGGNGNQMVPPGKNTLIDRAASVFAYWKVECGHPKALLTSDRMRKVAARLREGYSEADICRAIDGAAKHAYVNDEGIRFDDLELICRSGSKLEGFIQRAGATGSAAAAPASTAELAAAYERGRSRTGL